MYHLISPSYPPLGEISFIPTPVPQKKLVIMPDPAVLANKLLNIEAVVQFQNIVRAKRDFTEGEGGSPPSFDISKVEPFAAAIAFCQLSIRYATSSAYQDLLSRLALIQANKCLDRAPSELRAKGSKWLVHELYKCLGKGTDSEKTFGNHLSAAKSLNNNLRDLIPFLPFGKGRNAIRLFETNSEALQLALKAHPHYEVLSRTGKEFLQSIRERGEYAPRSWEVYPFGQELSSEHQIRLLGLETLPLEYKVEQGHIVTVQPISPSIPLSVLIPPSTVAGEGEAAARPVPRSRRWTKAENGLLIEVLQ